MRLQTMTFAFLLLMTPTVMATDLFAPLVHYPAGTQPRDVCATDLNGDHVPDLIVANEINSAVSVHLNDGAGLFPTQSYYLLPGQPWAITTARMDNDALEDIIVTNASANSFSVLINLGDGTLAAPVNYAVGPEPWGVTATDLNGDTYPDVAVVIHDADNFAVFLNNGDGTLSYSAAYPAGGAYISPAYLTSGNFNNDEYPDIAVTKNYHNLYFSEGYVQIYFNDGAGGFTSVQTITTGRTATTPIAADFDGDEDIDLAISGFVTNSYRLGVLINDGTGTFADPVTYSAGASGRAAGGDLDHDGDVDVLVSEEGVYSGSFSVLLNHGDGSFEYPFTVATGSDPMGIALADLDRDSDLDVAVAMWGENTVAVGSNLTDPVADASGPDVVRFRLAQNWPNPCKSNTVIRYALADAAQIHLAVYSPQGRLLRILASGLRGPGDWQVAWDGRDASGRALPGGAYLYRLDANGIRLQRALILLR